MSEGVNKWTGLGNLGADAELKYTGGGTAICRMRLACSEQWKDRDGQRQERTEWVTVVLFGKRAEGLAPHLSKGSRIYVEGPLRTRQWEDRDGNKRSTTEVIASEIKLQGGGRRDGGGSRDQGSHGGGGGADEPPDFSDDDLPFSVCTADDTRRLTRERWEVAL